MNITFCDLCGKEISRQMQPQAMWKDIEDDTLYCMCGECIHSTNEHIRSLRTEVEVYKAMAVTPTVEQEEE